VEEYEKTGELLVDLGSDQTSCHNPYNGGYYPVQLEYEEAQEVQYLTDVSFRGTETTMKGDDLRFSQRSLGCDAAKSGRNSPTFPTNVLPLSSGSKNKQNK
jgi:hypothetical protein